MIKKIASFLNKHTLLVLLILYFATRLYNLTLLPMFTDESIYIYWAKLIETTHSQWFISLYDGKPPMLTLMMALLLTFFPHEWHLIAGRLPSVFAGAVSVVGIYKLAFLIFKSKKIAIVAAVLYILFPFNLVYDRMALYDSLLTATLIWSVYFALKTAITLSFKDAVLWGVFLGLGFLSKPPAILFVLLTPLCFVFFRYSSIRLIEWKKVILLTGIAIVISELLNNIQRLSNSYSMMAIKNQQFQQPVSELLKNPFSLLFGNLYQFATWIIAYYTVPICIIGIVAFIFLFKKKPKITLILFSLWLIPMLILAILGRQVFPRYIVFVTPYFILPLAFFLAFLSEKFKSRRRFVFFLLAVFFLQIKFDFAILTNPPKAALPTADYTQYISEHPSGYGLDRIFSYLDKEAEERKIIIVTEGTFGLYPYAFQLRYWNNKNVTIEPRWPISTIDQSIFDLRKKGKVFIVLKEHQFIPGHLLLREIIKAEKPFRELDGKYPIYLTTFL